MEKIAQYIKFTKDQSETKSKVGGQPTHIPLSKPWLDEDDHEYGFLLELFVDGEILKVPNSLYLQIYQRIGEGNDPQPEVVTITPECPINIKRNIPQHPDRDEWGISFEERTESGDLLLSTTATLEYGKLFKTKIGGFDPWEKEEPGRTFLGQIHESPVGFNFAGMVCSLYLKSDGSVTLELS